MSLVNVWELLINASKIPILDVTMVLMSLCFYNPITCGLSIICFKMSQKSHIQREWGDKTKPLVLGLGIRDIGTEGLGKSAKIRLFYLKSFLSNT